MQNIVFAFAAGYLFAKFARRLNVQYKERLKAIRTAAEHRAEREYKARQRQKEVIYTSKCA